MLRTEDGFIEADDKVIPLTGFSAVIVQQVHGMYPRRIPVGNLFRTLEFAQGHIEKLLRFYATDLVPLSSLTGKIYGGHIVLSPGVVAIHPDTLEGAWEGRADNSQQVVWAKVPVVVPLPPSQAKREAMEASRHRRW